MKTKSLATFTIVALLGLGTSVASAQFVTPLWQRPTDLSSASATRTTYQVFDLMQDDDGDPTNGIQMATPDVANINPNGNTSLLESSNEAFITGTGNIYSPTTVLDMTLSVPSYAPASDTVTRFLVQIQTQGSELVRDGEDPITYDFSAFTINGPSLTALTEFDYAELSREPNTGQLVRHKFEFAVRSPTASTFDFSYQPLETSNSQQVVSIDTFSTILGDFDFDGDRDAADIDLLLRAEAGPTPPALSLFDLNEDDSVGCVPNITASDADNWVRTLESTEYGDANLDGHVNFTDLLAVAQNYDAPGTWSSGDFNGDDLVNFNDLLATAQNYGFGDALVSSFGADWQLAQSSVPEPASLTALSIGAALGLRRRRNASTL